MVCVKESYQPKVNVGHISVLGKEVTQLLSRQGPAQYLDCTFGAGGHSRLLLEENPEATIIGLDQDPDRRANFEALLSDFPGRVRFYPINFRDLGSISEVDFDGILFDFGVSSFQLDEAERGFSFSKDAPLDMRMNPTRGITAAEFLETATNDQLVTAIRNHGQETRWKLVVNAIQDARGTGILSTTKGLADLVYKAVGPKAVRLSKIHPATLTFQGIRIAINEELDVIEEALPKAYAKLKKGGVMACISFHSLEDRIVKLFFRKLCGQPLNRFDSTPMQLRKSFAKGITRKPVTASQEELETNARSRSAKLRAIQKEEEYIHE